MKKALLGLLALLAVSGCDLLKHSPNEPSENQPKNNVSYTAIGASDAIGFGSSIVCLPFTDCPAGMGYVPVIVRKFLDAGKVVSHLNLGIPGAVLGPDVQNIGNALGRDIFANFLDRELPFVPRDTTAVTIFAGGNDVNTVGAAIEAGMAGSDPAGYVLTQTQNFGRDMRTLVDGIRSRAPEARIVILNLPNLAAMPYANGYTITQKRWLQQIAVGFSAQINALASGNVFVVDLMCDNGFYSSSIFSSDGFHPNDTGYARIADRLFPVLNTGSATSPLASCSQMTIF
jgi:lysophospholipase L1-like esterase